ncbi:pentapeptide repeat-containing protein [Reyranella sp. CPCC 100927]|uniref:pentapeptide repeat-containing protein n=1 Tax=Reyranella sp. CPCC 100927 TaxID=2599616 RepID=UPI0011B73A88|nr:pentapeptide repeat-containing protein [Reyranella sp. CPCC 100927]TWT15453.1 pentapeptide repeat-containing protein [Reyranella sp. CPCC 100927]
MAVDPRDLEALEKAVNDASGKTGALWITFLTLVVYLVIAVGSVSHRILFLELPIKLPILNVELPLVGFFIAAPLLLFVYHFYLLLQLVVLARKAGTYDEVLRSQVRLTADRALFRRRLDQFPFLQLLVSHHEADGKAIRHTTSLITWLTTVAAPVFTLLMIQVIFLPYHDAAVTWIHRIIILADFAVLWAFWPAARSSRGDLLPIRKPGDSPAAMAAYVSVVFIATFVVLIATYQSEAIGIVKHHLPGARQLTANLFEGPVNQVTGLRTSIFSNTLVLSDQDFVDDERMARMDAAEDSGADGQQRDRFNLPRVRQSMNSFRGRDLRNAIFDRADLRRSDFTGADLGGASFLSAKLQKSFFGCGSAPIERYDDTEYRVREQCSRANHAHFVNANLDEAIFESAQFWRADMTGTRLRGARITDAQFVGAIFHETDFRGALVCGATFQHAQLHQAVLSGATIIGGRFQNANLRHTDWRVATVRNSNFQLSDFSLSDISGAQFQDVDVQGSTWRDVKLRYVLFEDVKAHGALLLATEAEMVMARGANLAASLEPTPSGKIVQNECVKQDPLEPGFLNRLRELLPRRSAVDASGWNQLARQPVDASKHRKAMDEYVAGVFCAPSDTPHVARGLFREKRVEPRALRSLAPVRDDVLAANNKCHGPNGLLVSDRLALAWLLIQLGSSPEQ